MVATGPYLLAERGVVGPAAGVEWHVVLTYYLENAVLARWNDAQWDTASAVWAGLPSDVEVGPDVLSLSFGYGRDEPLGRFRPGAATVNVDDPNGELSPWATAGVGEIYGALRPGIRLTIAATYAGDTYPLWSGWVESIVDGFPNPTTGAHTVTITAADPLQYLAAFDGLEQNPQGNGETAGPRLERIIANTGYDGARDLDAGVVDLQPTTLAGNALTEAGLVTDTEQGALFATPAGALRFVDRNGLTLDERYTDVQYVFGEVDPELCYADVALVTNADLVRNIVSISNAGGNAVTVVDSNSVAMFGARTYQRFDLIHRQQSESTEIANRYLAFFADAARRIESLTILPSVNPETIEAALRIGLLWRIQVRRRATGFQVVADLQIQGYQHEVTPSEWRVTYRTFSAAAIFAGGRWDVDKWDAGLWAY